VFNVKETEEGMDYKTTKKGGGDINAGEKGEGDVWTPRPLYPRGKSHRYALDKRMGGPQRPSERCDE
jgi:hypothetical protein